MRFAVRVVLLFAIALSTIGAAGSEGLRAWLDRMRDAGGPVWRTHLVSISYLTIGGEPVAITSDAQGLDLLLRECSGPLCTGTFFDGMRIFSVDMNGSRFLQERDVQTYLRGVRTMESLQFLDPAFAAMGGKIADGGLQRFRGRNFRVLLVTSPNAAAMEALVDPVTGLLAFARDSAGANVFEFGDYRRVAPDLMLPFYESRNGTTVDRYAERSANRLALNPPSGLGMRAMGPLASIPLDTNFRTPVIPCSIGGLSVRCLVDTGNSGLAMSSELAIRLKAPVAGAFAVSGIGHYTADVVRAGPLVVGNAEFGPAYYVVLRDIHDLGYDVVLGSDLFAASTVTLDVRGVSLAETPPANAAARIPLTFAGFVPIVAVELGHLPARLAVDTGDESSINLAGAFFSAHPSLFQATGSRRVVGVGGTAVEETGQIAQVRIGELSLADQDIAATPTLQGIAPGHLGMEFLRSFGSFFNYADASLTLTKPSP